MSQYKVIQDIEAEDRIIGPLTLRQFIYAGAGVILGYLSFLVITHGVAFMAGFFIPMAMLCIFFAWPWGRDQPTEIWALAKIRFLFKPRIKIWDQSGMKEMVTITVPRKVDINYTNGLSQTEVHSRLTVLANTIDSRGWAIKNVNGTLYSQPKLTVTTPTSDRLVSASSMPQAVPADDIHPSEDILDWHNSPIARQFDDMMAASAKAHRQKIIDGLSDNSSKPAAAPSQYSSSSIPNQSHWFMNQPSVSTPQDAVTFNAQVVAPGSSVASLPVTPAHPTPDEEQLIEKLAEENNIPVNNYTHLHTIQPLGTQTQDQTSPQQQAQQQSQNPPVQQPVVPATQPVTQPPSAGILDLARNNDLNVATIAREAQKRRESEQEVVISLH